MRREEKRIPIYSTEIMRKRTNPKITLGFYASKKILRKYVNKILTDLDENPERIKIEIIKDWLILS